MGMLKGVIASFGRCIVTCGLMLLLSACQVASRYHEVPMLSELDNVNKNKGVVVVRVISTAGDRYPFNELNLAPKNLNESSKNKIPELSARPAKSDHSVIFASAIEPGSYSLSSIVSYHSFAEYYYVNGVKAPLDFGTFTVEANKVTDLGTIIYYPKSQEDSFFKTLIRTPIDEPAKLIGQYFPFYEYDKAQVLTWDEDGFADERESTYLSAAQNPVSFTREFLADDGYLYVLAPLGVVLIRSPDGQWTTDAVDSNLAMRSIAKSAAGDVMIGGDEGKVFIKRIGSDNWEDISIDFTFDVQEVAFDDVGNILLFASRETYMGLFKSEQNIAGLAPNWQLVKRFNSRTGWHDNDGKEFNWPRLKKQHRIMNAELEKSEKGLMLRVYHQRYFAHLLIGDIETSRYNVDINTLDFNHITKKVSIDAVIDAGAMEVGIIKPGIFSWTGKPEFRVKNKQVGNWKRINLDVLLASGEKVSFRFLSTPWFGSPENGVAIAKIGEDKTPKVIISADEGKNWQATEYTLPNDYCVSIVPQIRDRILLGCDGATGDFYESADNGKTWEHVREHEEF